jgi:hypothetical protein
LNYIKSLKELWSKSYSSATFFPYSHCWARHLYEAYLILEMKETGPRDFSSSICRIVNPDVQV